jgi:hypothetical protein
LVLAGLSKAQIIDGIKAFVGKDLAPLEPGGMTYMMSRQGYLADEGRHWVPHLMFYVPQTDGMTWGADALASPVIAAVAFTERISQPRHEFGQRVTNRPELYSLRSARR